MSTRSPTVLVTAKDARHDTSKERDNDENDDECVDQVHVQVELAERKMVSFLYCY